jgi:hypothetical protein
VYVSLEGRVATFASQKAFKAEEFVTWVIGLPFNCRVYRSAKVVCNIWHMAYNVSKISVQFFFVTEL